MADKSYWQSLVQSRLNRRRMLTLSGSAAASAAFLAACGGGSNNNGGSSSSSGSASGNTGATGGSGGKTNSLVSTPTDTTAQAKPGGTLKHYATSDTLHFDALSSNSAQVVGNASIWAYARLLAFKAAKYPDAPDGSVVGEMAESYEISPDKLTVTLKLRQGVKWDPRPPTNARVMDMDDVKFSFDKYVKANPGAPNMVYDATKSPSAPVESMQTPDNQTIIFKLRAPNSLILPLIATPADGMYIMPKESDGGFDPKTATRGTGPWMLDEYTPSARYVWKKNPNYYVANRPFPDTIEVPIVTEGAQQLAQFRAGNIYTDVVARSQQNVVQTKKDVPQAQLVSPAVFPVSASPYIWFGYEGDSQFKDTRVRQAMSMLLDREGYNNTINNADAFRKEGYDLPAAQGTVVGVGWTGYWLDPTSSDFGDSAKYLKLNVDEAKKLLAAAGFSNGFSFDYFYNKEGTYGPAYDATVQLYDGMFRNGGLNPNLQGQAYAAWIPNFYFSYISANFAAGKAHGYNGIQQIAERPYVSSTNLLAGSFHKDGGAFHGMTPDGKNAYLGDPKVNDMIDQIKAEFDTAKQQSITHDVIRYITQQSYAIPVPMAAKAYTLNWPVIGNGYLYSRWAQDNAYPSEEWINWWIDTSKPPIAK